MDFVAGFGGVNRRCEAVRRRGVLTVQRGDDVASTNAGSLSGTARDDLQDDDTAAAVDPQLLGDLGGQRARLNPDVGMVRGPGDQQLISNIDHSRRGRGKTEGHRARRRRNVGLAHTHDMSLPIEQRATGVTGRNRGVSLDQVH